MSNNTTSRQLENKAPLAQENRLFVLARSGHLNIPGSRLEKQPPLVDKVLYPLVALLFGFLAPFISAIMGWPLLLLVISGSMTEDSAAALFVFFIGSFLPLFFLIWLWLRLFERRPLWTVGLERPFLKKYFRGLGVGLLMVTVVITTLALFNLVVTESPINGRLSLASLVGVLLIFLGWMVQGAAEEVLARGFLLPVIGSRWGTLAGVIVSSLFFALLHLLNPNVTMISLLNLALFGLFAALYALFEGGLWGIFAIHSIWNWAQGSLFGFEVSGLEIQAGTLFDLMEIGPDWITGGLFGPEGGIVVTIVLLISSALVWLVGKRREIQRV